MRNTITRTITHSTIKTATIDFVNGQPIAKENEPIVIFGECTKDQAMKKIKKVFGKSANVVLMSIETSDKFYEISVEDFIKHATLIENTEEVAQ